MSYGCPTCAHAAVSPAADPCRGCTGVEGPGLRWEPVRLDALLAASRRVARLNPEAGEIGAGMLQTIVAEARAALVEAGDRAP